MKSNITKMITMCMCMMVVGFASDSKKVMVEPKDIKSTPAYQKAQETKKLWHESQKIQPQNYDVADRFNSKEEYYNFLASKHGGSTIADWTEEDFKQYLAGEKLNSFGHVFEVTGERDSDHTFTECVDYYASEGSWAIYSYSAGYLTSTMGTSYKLKLTR